MWRTEFSWLRTGLVAGFYENGDETSGSIRKRNIF
jgi:hypothetical protein